MWPHSVANILSDFSACCQVLPVVVVGQHAEFMAGKAPARTHPVCGGLVDSGRHTFESQEFVAGGAASPTRHTGWAAVISL